MFKITKLLSSALLAACIFLSPNFAASGTTVYCALGDCDNEGVLYVERIIRTAANSFDNSVGNDAGLNVLIELNEGSRFDYTHKPGTEFEHVITIGDNFISSMYDGSAEDEVTFSAFLEWALYHEFGHVWLTYIEQQGAFRIDDSDHELFADIFATVVLLDELEIEDAWEAAFGMMGLIVPEAEARISAYRTRKGFADKPSNRRKKDRRKRLATAAGQLMGPHQPTEQRIHNIFCMTEMKEVFDQQDRVPKPGEGCDQDLDDIVGYILQSAEL